MAEMYMTLCDACAERMDAAQHDENKYYLEEVPGSQRLMECPQCFRIRVCTRYSAKSKAQVAMERAIQKQKENATKKDTRAHYKKPWRDWI